MSGTTRVTAELPENRDQGECLRWMWEEYRSDLGAATARARTRAPATAEALRATMQRPVPETRLE